MRIFLSSIRSEIDGAVREMQKPIAEAATAAMREVAETAVSGGRAQIRGAGFSTRWQSAFGYKLFPKAGKPSMRPAARVSHKFGIASVFEEGSIILGKPLLWVPLDSVPISSGKRRMTPKQYSQRFGRLRSVNRPGRAPLLVGPAMSGTIATKSKRKGSGAAERPNVPLFVGLSFAKMPKRFHLYDVIARAAARIGEFYLKNFKG